MGARERRENELKQRRELILKKSRELFFKRGYENVSIQDICEAVEYGRSAIYAHFRSKEEIYAHIHLEGLKMLAAWCERDMTVSAEDPLSGFVKFQEILCDFYEQQREYFSCMFFFSYKEHISEHVDPDINQAKLGEMRRIGAILSGIIKKGINEGQFKSMDITGTLELYWRSLTGIISYAVYEGKREDIAFIREQSRRHTEIYLEGLMAK